MLQAVKIYFFYVCVFVRRAFINILVFHVTTATRKKNKNISFKENEMKIERHWEKKTFNKSLMTQDSVFFLF